jgi:hypothetical protein
MMLLLAPVPRVLGLLWKRGWAPARALLATYALLAVISIATIYSHYPYFMSFVNHLGFGHPNYWLMSDSNLDWNQALPDVRQFVQQRGIKHVLVDPYAFIDPAVYVPQAQFWDCQTPTAADAGQWAVVSAAMVEDSANCLWLMNYPHLAIAGGSMYALELPGVIPPEGDSLGPPPPEKRRNFAGMQMDGRLMLMRCVKDPNQLQPTMDAMVALFREMQAKQKAEREAKRRAH